MTHVLSAREQKLLRHLQIDSSVFQIRGQLPLGTGTVTLTRLTDWACWRRDQDGMARPVGIYRRTAGAACMASRRANSERRVLPTIP